MDHLSDEDLREWRDRRDPSGQAIHSGPVYPLIDELLALRARVAKLEAALRFLREETKWKSVDKDNMEFEGRVTCYQLDQARAALKGRAPMSERLTPWWVAEGLGKYAMTDELLALRARVAKLEAVAKAYVAAVDMTSDGHSTDRSHYARVAETRDALLAAFKDAPQ